MPTIAAFYRFLPLPNPAALRDELRSTFASTDLLGTLLIAPEGINGTLAASPDTLDRLLTLLADRTGLPRADVKFSTAPASPFKRLKFKLKREIITFRLQPHAAPVDPARPGRYVSPEDWNALVADPSVLLLDTRNRYETRLGTFANATLPGIDNFSAFAAYVRDHLDPTRHTRVAMFCTGGIRCEKASAYMLQQGFPEVYHLHGGILKYLEQVPAAASLWQGTCYIFDERIALTHTDFAPCPRPLYGATPGVPAASVAAGVADPMISRTVELP